MHAGTLPDIRPVNSENFGQVPLLTTITHPLVAPVSQKFFYEIHEKTDCTSFDWVCTSTTYLLIFSYVN